VAPNIGETPANVQTQLLIPVDFKQNNMATVLKYAQPRCRFSSGGKVEFSEGQIVAYPFQDETSAGNANSIHCKTPRWKLDSEEAEKATLDLTLNG